MSYLSVRNKIYNIINGLKETDSGADLFANVYKYDASNPEGAPVVMIILGNIENESETNTENRRTYSFTIRVEYDFKQNNIVNEEEVDEYLMGIADKIVNAMDQDYTLGGEVDYVQPTPAEPLWVTREGGQSRAVIFTIKAFTLVDVTP